MVHTRLRSERYSILIADDEAGSREVLRDIVEPEGYEIMLAEDGEAALDIVQRRPVHLLVLDMNMPRLSGLETFQMARQFKTELPGILVSADVTDELIRRALSARAYSVLAKPVKKPVLLYTIVRALMKAYEARQ